MRWGSLLDRFWRRPATREARNEQKKALAGVFNAIAIAMAIAGVIGPWINPELSASLSPIERIGLIFGAGLAHLGVRAILWTLEDK